MKKQIITMALALSLFRFSASVPQLPAARAAAYNAGASYVRDHISVSVTYDPVTGEYVTRTAAK